MTRPVDPLATASGQIGGAETCIRNLGALLSEQHADPDPAPNAAAPGFVSRERDRGD